MTRLGFFKGMIAATLLGLFGRNSWVKAFDELPSREWRVLVARCPIRSGPFYCGCDGSMKGVPEAKFD